MDDVWDIAQYVESHPDNHAQRWRLAKKLYMAWEYRLALEHLLVLKNEWNQKLNVTRYLAATYYRLSRYDDALKELESGLNTWPQELDLREQYARTLAVAGNKEAAITAWEQVLVIQPDHPFCTRAIGRLRKELGYQDAGGGPPPAPESPEHPERDLVPADDDDIVCSACGQLNSPDFHRCWQCHAALTEEQEPKENLPEETQKKGVPWNLLSGLTIAALLALGVYLTLSRISALASVDSRVPADMAEFLDSTLLWTRIITGAVLLVCWPIVWRVSAILVGAGLEVYSETMYQLGALMALLAYCLFWAPWPWFLLAVALPLGLSAGIALLGLDLKPKTALSLWLSQALLAVTIGLLVVIGRHGIGVIPGIPAAVAFAARDTQPPVEIQGALPIEIRVRWESSGSSWLDANAARCLVEIESDPHVRGVYLEVTGGGKTLHFRQIQDEHHEYFFTGWATGTDYRIVVRSEESVECAVALRSLLLIEVEYTTATPASPSS